MTSRTRALKALTYQHHNTMLWKKHVLTDERPRHRELAARLDRTRRLTAIDKGQPTAKTFDRLDALMHLHSMAGSESRSKWFRPPASKR